MQPEDTSRTFPGGFTWGTATASYQIEGGWLEGGKGLSIWDAFAHTPGRIITGETADVSCDHFHRYKEDVALMKQAGVNAYRFSIAWPRIQPDGRGPANQEGIRFYSNLVDELLANGITPWVTLYHWDLPLALQTELDGWNDPRLPDLFAAYARHCFSHLGDRVKNWITLNEPWVISVLGYGLGVFAPGRTSTSEPYQVAHQLLRAHAKAADVYRRDFQPGQGGRIGISLNCDWREPLTQSAADRAAAERSVEFFLGWFADPIYTGDYPPVMRERVGNRLPSFTAEDAALVKGSCDFLGINHYTTMYAAHSEAPEAGASVFGNGGLVGDQGVALSRDESWPEAGIPGWSIVPWGCRKLLVWADRRYGRPEIVITENGCAFPDKVVDGKVHDPERIGYLAQYLGECHRAIAGGIRLSGYFVWSLMDNFEWAFGFSKRFGLYHVDFATGRRTPKSSVAWYREVIRRNGPPDM